jgi:predicted ATP-dependent endonuclease of OLD family
MSNVKINKSVVKNIKNIDEFEVDFNGATAYIIGGNTKGKTTFIRFLIDRLLSNTNDSRVLKDQTKEGYSEIQMSDGASFRYIITPEGKEKRLQT